MKFIQIICIAAFIVLASTQQPPCKVVQICVQTLEATGINSSCCTGGYDFPYGGCQVNSGMNAITLSPYNLSTTYNQINLKTYCPYGNILYITEVTELWLCVTVSSNDLPEWDTGIQQFIGGDLNLSFFNIHVACTM